MRTPINGTQFFSRDYASARQTFLSAANQCSAEISSYEIQARGPKAEPLSIDLAWLGPANASRIMMSVSGTHGVEGFAGSAIQRCFLEAKPELPDDCAFVALHALNPYGMAHGRRVNEHNVDLNRNYVTDPSVWKLQSDVYRKLDSFLNPHSAPRLLDFFYPRLLWGIARHGMQAFKQATAAGQYDFPKGLFYGGSRFQESITFLDHFLKDRVSHPEKLYAIEVHTGLGTMGTSTILTSYDEQDVRIERLRNLFPNLSVEADDAADVHEQRVAYRTNGAIDASIERILPNTKVHWILQEVGTYSAPAVLAALRAENRAFHHGTEKQRIVASRRLAEVFNPNSDTWRNRAVRDGIEILCGSFGLMLGDP